MYAYVDGVGWSTENEKNVEEGRSSKEKSNPWIYLFSLNGPV
jgi:hypothetical protein